MWAKVVMKRRVEAVFELELEDKDAGPEAGIEHGHQVAPDLEL